MKLDHLLMNRFNYPEQDAKMLAERLEALEAPLKPILDRWIADGAENDDTMFEGYSVNTLCSGGAMNFIAALLTLDWLLREPEAAKAAIRRGV